ncbi:MAG TPA: cupin domain-containing protein [Dyella sp.]|uniref:cupin domain-containing protein n=1 Tax=Dyella sp. TaxID=1869338 RepID=UPI002C3D3803|nr:cupin domain-containing protein [Dyella sp.]HTV85012.1 cupin domain-containing protein [Dyella sp.]
MTDQNWMFALQDAIDKLPGDEAPFRLHYGLRHGTMKVGLYAPRGEDNQTPHAQDELYIVVSGAGEFVKNGIRSPFKAQDVIFVEAGATHRFEKFSEDFATWVVFWGAQGGES